MSQHTVTHLARRTKAAISEEIAKHLGVPAPPVSNGASVHSDFLDAICSAKFGSLTGGTDTYRRTEKLLTRFGLTYDPWWDTSESRGETGGGTVSTRAFSRILGALLGHPRVFILGDASVTNSSRTLYFQTRPDSDPFAEAGPGSLILHCSPGPKNQLKAFAVSTVLSTSPGWRHTPWEAQLSSPTQLQESQDLLVGFTVSNTKPIEIRWAEFNQILQSGNLASTPDTEPAIASAPIAERIDTIYPAVEVTINAVHIPPAVLDPGPVSAIKQQDFLDSYAGGTASTSGITYGFSRDRATMKIIEKRAIQYATRALVADGWTLIRDTQLDGAGYDLHFKKNDRDLKVEVKGIQSSVLSFNLTPKEWWRAESDPCWILIAVINALSPTAPRVIVVPRDKIVSADRVVLGYRVGPMNI